MLILIGLLMAAPGAPNAAGSAAICDVGRIALQDLPHINHNTRFDAYYANADPLLKACPKLQREIPTGYPLEDDDARSRASVHAPIPGRDVRPAFIYSISVPKISADRRTATVEMGYDCTGLCGGHFVAHYIRISKSWRRKGEIEAVSVS